MAAIAILALALAAGAAQAQPDPAPSSEARAQGESVEVAHLRHADFKSYALFARGLEVLEAKRALAPDAPALFRLVPSRAGAPVGDVTMRIAGDTISIPVPVSPDGTFSMPRSQVALDEDAGIFLNKKRGDYRWRPSFFSPGLPPGMRRLGDLRLECEVFWAVGRAEAPLPPRTVADAAGGACRSGMIKLLQWAPRPVVEYSMVAGERRQRFTPPRTGQSSPLPVYWVPLHDASWPDDTLIEFVYAPQA